MAKGKWSGGKAPAQGSATAPVGGAQGVQSNFQKGYGITACASKAAAGPVPANIKRQLGKGQHAGNATFGPGFTKPGPISQSYKGGN